MRKVTPFGLISLALLNVDAIAAQTLNPITYASGQIAYTNSNIVVDAIKAPAVKGSLLVENGKITQILPPDAQIPAGYQQVDLNNSYVMPGFIDAHIHLAQSASAFTRPDMIGATKIQPYQSDQAWLNQHRQDLLSDYLKVGITAVVDLGGPSGKLQHYADAATLQPSPDIYAAAELISTAAVPELEHEDHTFLAVSSAKEALAAVKMQLGLPIQVVKFVWTDEAGHSPEQLFTIYADAMQHARKAGKIVAVHVEDLAYAKMAIKAHANILVHGVMTAPVDDEFIALAKQHQVVYLPTLTAYNHYRDIFKQQLSFSVLELALTDHAIIESFQQLKLRHADTAPMFKMLTKYLPYVDDTEAKATLKPQEQAIVAQLSQLFSDQIALYQQQNLRHVLEAGVAVAIGTDAGNPGTVHGSAMLGEAQAWLEAGISIQQVIHAMTLGNARAYHIDQSLGSLTSGKDATFSVYDTNPVSDSFATMTPKLVVIRGNIALTNEE